MTVADCRMATLTIKLTSLERASVGGLVSAPVLFSADDAKQIGRYSLDSIVQPRPEYIAAMIEVRGMRARNDVFLKNLGFLHTLLAEKGLESRTWSEWLSAQEQECPAAYARILQHVSQDDALHMCAEILCKGEQKWKADRLRSLYGIAAIIQGRSDKNQYLYKGFVLPPENTKPALMAMKTGVFEKHLEHDDVVLLDYIRSKTEDISDGNHNQRFSTMQLSDGTGWEYLEARESLERLTGVLCHTYGPERLTIRLDGKKDDYLHDQWYLPNARMRLAKEIISENI
jgi:hypothetical protein